MKFKSKYEVPNGEALSPTELAIYVPLDIRTDENGSRGVFAKQLIPEGRVIARDGGTVVTSTADAPIRNVAVLIGEGLLLAPSDYEKLSPLESINHSCDSNIARIGGLVYVAKRKIEAGEELTLDYAPLISEHGNWTMNCSCGVPNCRKVITSQDWRNPDLQQKLWREWLPFIQEKILK